MFLYFIFFFFSKFHMDDILPNMTAVERKQHILDLLKKQEIVEVSQLCKVLDVSKVTIRADLDDLESRGMLVRTHGGAILPENQKYVRLITNTMQEYPEEKSRIALLAMTLLSPGETVIIDSGSTTVHIADTIAEHRPSMVVTNSLLVVDKLRGNENFELFIAGGMFRKEGFSVIGNYACACFEQIHADILFMGATGISVEEGVTCTNLIEADTKKAMIKHSRIVALLADHSKIGVISTAHVCDWSSIDYFITDALDASSRATLEAQGVTVMITSEKPKSF